jgi:hypothetical protein
MSYAQEQIEELRRKDVSTQQPVKKDSLNWRDVSAGFLIGAVLAGAAIGFLAYQWNADTLARGQQAIGQYSAREQLAVGIVTDTIEQAKAIGDSAKRTAVIVQQLRKLLSVYIPDKYNPLGSVGSQHSSSGD